MELTKTYSDIAEYGEKYHFYHNTENGTVVCTRLYKGHIIRGAAKCCPEDNFNLETGKKLAYLRCKEKFMYKKVKRAQCACVEASNAMLEAKDNLVMAREFLEDSENQLESAHKELIKLVLELNC